MKTTTPTMIRLLVVGAALACGARTIAQEVQHPGVAGPLPVASKASLADPAARPHVFADPDWFIWGGTPVLGDDGKYHLYYDRWPRDNGRLMRGWLYVSEIAHAVAAAPEGPYVFQDVALRAPGGEPAGRWDAVNAHNAYCVRLPDPESGTPRYYLYFVANRDTDSMKDDWLDHIVSQRIGVAVADSPGGPWKRQAEPACIPQAPLRSYVVNPGVTRLPNGKFLMLLKGREKETTRGGEMGAYLQGWALADKPTGPFVIQSTLLFPSTIAAEDPCVFVWDGRVYAAVKDWNGQLSGTKGIAWLSGELQKDGAIKWTVPSDAVISARTLSWSDGTATALHSLERPFILQDARGRPTHLFAAAAVQDPFVGSGITPVEPPPKIGGSNLPFNVCIPLTTHK